MLTGFYSISLTPGLVNTSGLYSSNILMDLFLWLDFVPSQNITRCKPGVKKPTMQSNGQKTQLGGSGVDQPFCPAARPLRHPRPHHRRCRRQRFRRCQGQKQGSWLIIDLFSYLD